MAIHPRFGRGLSEAPGRDGWGEAVDRDTISPSHDFRFHADFVSSATLAARRFYDAGRDWSAAATNP